MSRTQVPTKPPATKAWRGGFCRGEPDAARILSTVRSPQAGAVAMLAPTARDVDLVVTPKRGTSHVFRRALLAARGQGAMAAAILHGTGRIRAGRPMVVVAAAARSRRDAMMSVEIMLNALQGVAQRRDASKA